MARIFTENFETPANGATLTASNTSFTSYYGGAATASTAHFVGGSKSGYWSVGGTSGTCAAVYDSGSQHSVLYLMFYIYLPALPSTAVYAAALFGSGTMRAQVRINADGTVSLRNSTTAVYTSSVALQTGAWSRIEWRVDNTAASQQLRLYTGSNYNSSTATSDSGNQTYNQGTFNAFYHGVTAAVTNVNFYTDYAAIDDSGWVGPAVTVLTANAGSAQTVTPSSAVTLHGSATGGSGSYTYSWSQTAGTAVSLSSTTAQNPTFTAPSAAGTLTFKLTVNDGFTTATSTVNVTVASNLPPTVNAGAAQGSIEPWSPVTLTGTATDSDGSVSSVQWTQISGTAVTLTNANSLTCTYTSPGTIAGDTATFQLKATDNLGASSTSTTTVTTLPATERAVINGVEVPCRFRSN